MTFPLPIKDTPNNNAFKSFFADIVDGDLFHQRYETETFIFNIIADHGIAMSRDGYRELLSSAGIFFTHKPTGIASYKKYYDKSENALLSALLSDIKSGNEQKIINNPLNIAETLSTAAGYTCVAGLASRLIDKREYLSDIDSHKIMKKLFIPLDKAIEDNQISDFVIQVQKGMTPGDRYILQKHIENKTSLIPYSSDHAMFTSFSMIDAEGLINFRPSGGKDISNAYNREFYPPIFQGESHLTDDIGEQVIKRRVRKVEQVCDDVRREALVLSSLNHNHEGATDTEIKEIVDRAYPVIKEACQYDQENWDLFIGKNHKQIRNRSQILEGPMKGGSKGLSILLGNEQFKAAIDSGTSLKEPLKNLPVFNTSKRSVLKFLNNVSEKSEDVMTETGRVPKAQVKMGAAISSTRDLNLIASIQSVPSKYFNDNGHHLAKVFNMPYIGIALPAAIHKVRDGEWKAQQAFQWIQRLENNKEAHRLSMEVSDTERIIEQFYINTLSSYIIYQSDLDLSHAERLRYRESPVAEELIKSMATTMPYSNILNLSSEVHKRSQDLLKIGAPDSHVSWKPAISEDYVNEDITITPIHNTSDMALEGAELNHCVGTYVRPAMDGETFIFGARDNKGNRLSTIEVIVNDEDKYEMNQHFAASNSEPSEKEKRVAEEFMEKINSGDIAFNQDTHVSRNDLDKLLPIQRAEVEQGIRFSDTEVALEALHHLKEMMPFTDPIQLIKDDLSGYRPLYHDRESIKEVADELEDLHQQKRGLERAITSCIDCN